MKNQQYAYQLSPQDFLDRAKKILLQDKQKLANSNYPVYQSPVNQGKSPLTQRAQDLTTQKSSGSAPYTTQMEQLMGRSNPGFSPPELGAHVQTLQQRQQDFANQRIHPALQREFGAAYEPSRPDLGRYIGRDINLGGQEYQEKIGEIGGVAGNLDRTRADQLMKSMQSLRGQEEGKGDLLKQGLTQFGEEQQGYQNYADSIYRKAFDKEQRAPYERADQLENTLRSLSDAVGNDEIHPDILKMKMEEGMKGLRSYGVDTSKHPDQWDKSRVAPPQYKGELVAPLTPEMKASYNTMGNLSSNFQDKHAGARLGLMNKLLTDTNPSERVLKGVPSAIHGRASVLENAAQETLNKDIEGINNRFIRRGQYGTPANLRAATERGRAVNKAAFEQMQKMGEGALRANLATEHGSQIADIDKLNQYGAEGYKEYLDTLAGIKGEHDIGLDKFKSRQKENEEGYANFQNEALWEMPHMRAAAREKALGEIFPAWGKAGNTLQDLVNMNTSYKDVGAKLSKAEQQNQDYAQQIFGLQGQLTNQSQAQANYAAQLKREQDAQAAAQKAQVEERSRLEALMPGYKRYKSPLSMDFFKKLNEDERSDYMEAQARNGWPISFEQRKLHTPEEDAGLQWLLADLEGRKYNVDDAIRHANSRVELNKKLNKA